MAQSAQVTSNQKHCGCLQHHKIATKKEGGFPLLLGASVYQAFGELQVREKNHFKWSFYGMLENL